MLDYARPSPAVEAAFLEALARGELIVEATTAQDFWSTEAATDGQGTISPPAPTP